MPVTVASAAGALGAAGDGATELREDESAAIARGLTDWLRSVAAPGAVLRNDSRRVERGDVFFAYPGAAVDGRGFISQALAHGAAAILWERDGFRWPRQWRVPNKSLPNLRRLCGPIAAEYHGHPSRRLNLVAVTGTNGKTSCAQWIAQGLAHAGRAAATIGTLGSGRPGALTAASLTTPDALALQRQLAQFVDDGVTDVSIEASSIGVDQGRLDGCRVEVAVFTNLTRDHLDYHGSMAAYANAKAALFAWPGLRAAVVNLDDPAGATMLAAAADRVRRIGYSIAGAAAPRDPRVAARLIATAIEPLSDGQRLQIDGDFGRGSARIAAIGAHNASNALAVLGAWLALGVPLEHAIGMLERLEPVPGRLQPVPAAAGAPRVLVDYAHTPDALRNALAALRPLAQARGGALWCVFGAGGDRDPGKRAPMGAAAEQHADRIVVTSDNPRSEPPDAIIAAIVAGCSRPPYRTEVDRAAAIEAAIRAADPRDVVLIAGKGHEPYQEVAGQRLPFSDAEQAARALAARGRADV